MSIFNPQTAAEAADLVRAMRGAGLRIAGAIPHAPKPDSQMITTVNLNGITRYEPQDFTITARAGTRLSEIVDLLRAKGQRLDFEPLSTDPATTIGAIAATNASGPRRPFAGSARDALLGAGFVTGLGEVVAAGSRVLKNVAGLDLTRLLAGSCGNLGLLTEVTFRTRQTHAFEKTLILPGVQPSDFPGLVTDFLHEGLPVSGAVHLSASLARGLLDRDEPTALIRIEGDEGISTLRPKVLKGEIGSLSGHGSGKLWQQICQPRDMFPATPGAAWCVTCPISQGGHLANRLLAIGTKTLVDWRGGKIWCWHENPAAAPAVLEIIGTAPSTHARHVSGPKSAATVRRISAGQLRFEHAIKRALDPENTFDTKPYLRGFAGEG